MLQSKLARVFIEMKTYLLDMSSKKKKLQIIKEKSIKNGEQRLITQIYSGWIKRSSSRMAVYKGVKMLEGSTKQILEVGKFKTLHISFSDLRRWTKKEAQLQILAARLQTQQRKKRLQRGFASLASNMHKNIGQRRALNLLNLVLKARQCKSEVFATLLKKAHQQVQYLKFAGQLDLTCKKHCKAVVLDKLGLYCQAQLLLMKKAESKQEQTTYRRLSNLLHIWRGIVQRKKLVTSKGEQLEKTLQSRLVERSLKTWTEKVFSDKYSLFCRFKTLEKCLTQVRAVRAIDHMSSRSY